MDTDTTRRAGAPEFPWRGLGIDIARHFFPVGDIEILVDLIADLGLSVLHLHLTDDQGWRIEVPGWPDLTERSGPEAVGGDPGGMWTREDWERLRRRARERDIWLVPEIDVPGHTRAALHAAEGLNPDGRRPPAYHGIEVGFSTLSTAAPDTGRFLSDVLSHACLLGEGWVHIGGDESPMGSHEEYLALAGRAVDVVHGAGSRVVAWQEAADLLGPGDVVQVWDERLDLTPVVAASRRGVQVLVSPATHAYLDMKEDATSPTGLTWAGMTSLREALEWDPRRVVAGVEREAIIGVEACVWTETIRTFDELTTMLLPRLAAVADVAWTGSGVGCWRSFRERVPALAREWTRAGLAWRRSPGVDWDA